MGVATVALVVAGGIAIAKGVSGAIKKKKAKNKEQAAQDKLNAMKDDYKNIDTSNPFKDAKNAFEGLDNKFADAENVYEGAENVYEGKMENKFAGQKNAYEGMKNQFEGMENAFEDLTVNTQQAEFEAQQNQQQQANIMSQMAGAAGGSGIAALAQSMANQGALQAQKAAASIGAQESQNQKLAADASQKISMATAGEGSKIAMAQAGEQSRLDTQANQADMDIQKTVLGADEALQTARLGEASKLQMAEMGEASKLQLAEAQGAMQQQELKGKGQMWSAEQGMRKSETLMGAQASTVAGHKADKKAGEDRMWSGISTLGNIAGGMSDKRLKEDIYKIGYSDSGIPTYMFKYKGKNSTYIGTIAQDLLKLGRNDAVVLENNYYKVNYNLIDIDMKKLKTPSPLKQLDQGTALGATPQEHLGKQEAMTDAGMDILAEAKRRKNWEELQLDIKMIEPQSMQDRKYLDQLLRDNQRKVYDTGNPFSLGPEYVDIYMKQVKGWQKELYEALKGNDKAKEKEIMMRLATMEQTVQVIKDNMQEFFDDNFETESQMSKGNSQQQRSFGTQIYCKNPDLVISLAEKEDVEIGRVDYYGDIVKEGGYYAIVKDFYNNVCFVSVIDGNKDIFIKSNLKAIEYLAFLNQTNEDATQARKDKAVVKAPLGRIDYKINTLFGNNDGTASKEQDHLVLQFAWDDDILEDGSTFRRHLYEHPNIENLNYGGFDFDKMEFNQPLREGDKNYWHDQIDDLDRLRLVDAICNQDSPFFDMKLLRTLVKEYYIYKIENAWWKGMGYEEGKLDLMRLKQNELVKERFKRDKAAASKEGRKEFTFDGEVYPTGMTDAKIAKQKKEQEEAMKKAPQQAPNIPQ